MATLTIRNLPDELHSALKERAKRNRRSLNQEIIAELAASNQQETRDDGLLERVAILRAQMKGFLTPEEIDSARREGRE